MDGRWMVDSEFRYINIYTMYHILKRDTYLRSRITSLSEPLMTRAMTSPDDLPWRGWVGKTVILLKTHTEFALEPKWLRAILVSANSQKFEGVYVIRESTESNKEGIQIKSSLILNFSL